MHTECGTEVTYRDKILFDEFYPNNLLMSMSSRHVNVLHGGTLKLNVRRLATTTPFILNSLFSFPVFTSFAHYT